VGITRSFDGGGERDGGLCALGDRGHDGAGAQPEPRGRGPGERERAAVAAADAEPGEEGQGVSYRAVHRCVRDVAFSPVVMRARLTG